MEKEYRELGDEDPKVTEVESLCMRCGENGLTKFLLINIPFFKEIIISQFECPHCGESNNEVQSAREIQQKGVRYTLVCEKMEDLNRSLVKSDSCSFALKELDFQIPAGSQKGILTTVEGIVTRAMEGLAQDQGRRCLEHPELYEQIEAFIRQLRQVCEGSLFPFTIVLDDPAGNSFIQNPYAPEADPQMEEIHYTRSVEQDLLLGIAPERTETTNTVISAPSTEEFNRLIEDENPRDAVLTMPVVCNACQTQGDLRMHVLDIPHFKEVVIMAFTCENCGYKSNEVKAGGAIAPLGRRYTLNIKSVEDMNRDVLKSETASVSVPELGLQVVSGTLGGRFTTVEGLLIQVKEELQKNPFILGDSSTEENREKMDSFFEKYDKLLALEQEFTFILDDPVGNSYLQNIYAPDPDPYLHVEEYERSDKQNEELGITQMRTENYMDTPEK